MLVNLQMSRSAGHRGFGTGPLGSAHETTRTQYEQFNRNLGGPCRPEPRQVRMPSSISPRPTRPAQAPPHLPRTGRGTSMPPRRFRCRGKWPLVARGSAIRPPTCTSTRSSCACGPGCYCPRRSVLAAGAQSAGLSPEVEKPGLLPQRPDDELPAIDRLHLMLLCVCFCHGTFFATSSRSPNAAQAENVRGGACSARRRMCSAHPATGEGADKGCSLRAPADCIDRLVREADVLLHSLQAVVQQMYSTIPLSTMWQRNICTEHKT